MLEHERHNQIGHYVEACGDEAQINEAEPHLLGLDVELVRPPFTHAESVMFEEGLDAVDHISSVPARPVLMPQFKLVGSGWRKII